MKMNQSKPRRKIKLSHGQTIKQSHSYQSAEASFSAELVVDYTDKEVRKGFRKLATIVEENLAKKVDQQREFLHNLTGDR